MISRATAECGTALEQQSQPGHKTRGIRHDRRRPHCRTSSSTGSKKSASNLPKPYGNITRIRAVAVSSPIGLHQPTCAFRQLHNLTSVQYAFSSAVCGMGRSHIARSTAYTGMDFSAADSSSTHRSRIGPAKSLSSENYRIESRSNDVLTSVYAAFTY